MDEKALAVLADYEERIVRENKLGATLSPEAELARRDEFLLPIGKETGMFLSLLIRSGGAKTILEVGTSYGYSTLWLADAARDSGGMVHTLERAGEKADHARAQIERAGLGAQVRFHVGDARELIARLPGPFDVVLLDLWKDLYIPCFDLVRPKLAPGGFVVADNMLQPERARPDAAGYRAHVRATGLSTVLLPIGNGIEVTRAD